MSEPEPRPLSLELVSSSDLSPSVKSLLLWSDAGADFHWIPGQYVELVVPGSAVQRQPYSIASVADREKPGCFELAVQRGPDTAPLHELAPGARLAAHGPLGNLTRARAVAGAALFVAGGTGVAPLRAMILDQLAEAAPTSSILLFGVRSRADLLWEQELTELSRRSPHFRFEPTLSRPEETWNGRRGYVQQHFAELVGLLPGAPVFVCGSPRMVDECVEALQAQGVERARIVTEKQ